MSMDDGSSKKPAADGRSRSSQPVLQSPGPDSNFLDWELVITAYFDSVGIDYVIESPLPERPSPAWTADNKTVCAILTQTIDSSNLIAIRPYKRNAHGMWNAIVRAHQDSSTGGRVYWLRKLLLTKMDGDDVLTHINTMAKAYDRLNSLVTTDKPLTVADVHSAALLSSIPDDWMGCVSHLMNQEGTKTKPNNGKRPGDRNKKRHCDFCNADGHNLNNCNNTRRILDEHKAGDDNRTPLPSPPAHAHAPPKGVCNHTRPSLRGGFDRTPLGVLISQGNRLPRGGQKNPPLRDGREEEIVELI
ncbi:uncharacterized protein PGTG_13224 [Puccinia graminis f. sp. tritici CRL 75-36-700-3]|uniref:Uncharacterized protein n=1 Tax=Puccinia graminis f. sp. tritici (strain CRL 75-36-700-3 / race SCCL) TaxID=418459 RepID=E3KRB7_PUCGT|nr:uncharacterized protein PGTG_13224 [Puccinia graminis f. sp. tritici CRL 75-36-700-3]EFP86842.2 hypothetical protein PGTG_13224 [Puccinia graminis f. sp. tritici CRL 75-36-700-3]